MDACSGAPKKTEKRSRKNTNLPRLSNLAPAKDEEEEREGTVQRPDEEGGPS